MRVALPHFGQSVDFAVSMTFLRSAVFAIFAICKSPFGAARLRLLWRGMGNLDRRSSGRPSARKPPRKLFATGTRKSKSQLARPEIFASGVDLEQLAVYVADVRGTDLVIRVAFSFYNILFESHTPGRIDATKRAAWA